VCVYVCVCVWRERERERERQRQTETEKERGKSTNADAVVGHVGTTRAYRQQPHVNLLALLVQKYKC